MEEILIEVYFQMGRDFVVGDMTAIEELLKDIPLDTLINYLPEDKQIEIIQNWDSDEVLAKCVYSGIVYIVGETGNELGFSEFAMNQENFPYDIDAYYKDYDNGKVAFKGFDTMARGILENYLKK